jgi:hypothetical protein
MRKKSIFLVIASAFLSLLVLFAPQGAMAAQILDTSAQGTATNDPGICQGTTGCTPPLESSGTLCPGASSGNNLFDSTMRANTAAHTQFLSQVAKNVNTQYPIVPAVDQCLANITMLITKLGSLGSVADPLNLASAVVNSIISSMITNLINGVCATIMSEITSVINSVVNLAKVCIPLPKFGSFSLPAFSQSACSGGAQINLLNGSVTGSSTALYNYQQYVH